MLSWVILMGAFHLYKTARVTDDGFVCEVEDVNGYLNLVCRKGDVTE